MFRINPSISLFVMATCLNNSLCYSQETTCQDATLALEKCEHELFKLTQKLKDSQNILASNTSALLSDKEVDADTVANARAARLEKTTACLELENQVAKACRQKAQKKSALEILSRSLK